MARKSSVSLRADLAELARKRARSLQIAGGVYLRILLRNAHLTGEIPPLVPESTRYVRVPVGLVMAKSERDVIARRAGLSLPELLERAVAADTAQPKRPLVILPNG